MYLQESLRWIEVHANETVMLRIIPLGLQCILTQGPCVKDPGQQTLSKNSAKYWEIKYGIYSIYLICTEYWELEPNTKPTQRIDSCRRVSCLHDEMRASGAAFEV